MPLSALEPFDAPILNPNCEKRSFSTIATQALLLMNGPFLTDSARAFAARVFRETGPDDRARVRLAWKLAFGKEASEAELADALAYLAEQPSKEAWATFCHALLSSNAFLYVD